MYTYILINVYITSLQFLTLYTQYTAYPYNVSKITEFIISLISGKYVVNVI